MIINETLFSGVRCLCSAAALDLLASDLPGCISSPSPSRVLLDLSPIPYLDRKAGEYLLKRSTRIAFERLPVQKTEVVVKIGTC